MDLAVISCGETVQGGTSLTEGFVPLADYQLAIENGAVADVMCHFLAADGAIVEVPVSARVMSVPPEDIRMAKEVVLACGGANRAVAIRATLLGFNCKTLVTDEAGALALMKLEPNKLDQKTSSVA
jgi:DNA-binding transcriptional regulator LsrR (DeoR family)